MTAKNVSAKEQPEEAARTTATVTLDTPIIRGTQVIESVVVRKPQAGALRGTRLQALMDMDVDSMMVVLPRVTTPSLTREEVLIMEPGDLVQLSVELVSFLLPKRATAGIQQS